MPDDAIDKSYSSALLRAKGATDNWRRLYRTWWAIHYSTGILGVVAATLSATATAQEHPFHTYGWTFGILAAVCTSLITFLGPVQRAQRYWKAFYKADQALFAFDAQQIDIKQLVREIADSRQIILNESDPRPSPP